MGLVQMLRGYSGDAAAIEPVCSEPHHPSSRLSSGKSTRSIPGHTWGTRSWAHADVNSGKAPHPGLLRKTRRSR
jgi:hypothetical protein